jgi:hypothetical protein
VKSAERGRGCGACRGILLFAVCGLRTEDGKGVNGCRKNGEDKELPELKNGKKVMSKNRPG